MAEKNGTTKFLKIITLALVVVVTISGYIVTNDVNSRARDAKIIEKVNKIEVDFGCQLSKILTKLEYIEQKV